VNNMFRLDGKVAIVTGGNGGIGKAIAAALASVGANIAIAARNRGKTARAVEEITRTYGVKAVGIETDVVQEDQIAAMVKRTADTFGRIDILVNNAGIAEGKEPMAVSTAEWDTVINTNLRAAFLCSKAVYPYMKTVGGGKIINIGSMASVLGSSVLPAYSASKGGIVQMGRSLAIAWAADNIQVNAILPGWIKTDLGKEVRALDPTFDSRIASLIPVGRYGEPPELGGTAIFLASQASSYVTGVALPVDGGFSIVLRGFDGPFPPPRQNPG
jgi:2-deoxy-D-gluconate 3-dehydrogenase